MTGHGISHIEKVLLIAQRLAVSLGDHLQSKRPSTIDLHREAERARDRVCAGRLFTHFHIASFNAETLQRSDHFSQRCLNWVKL